MLALVLCGSSLAGVAFAEQDAIRPSVVKIHSTQRLPDFYRPWTKAAPREVSGTGFIIDGKRIVTNAHVVGYASQIYVQPYQSAEKYLAKVVGLAMPMDLAVLSVDDEAFFTDRPPLALDEGLPRVKAAVNVYGFPVGGDQISVTEGISSRVEYAGYHFDAAGLRIQIDAALNPGNSGGPAISENKVIGVAFSGLAHADNIGYLIPAEEVRTFLADIQDGKYDGKPQLREETQTAENDALRARLKLPKDVGGCMVNRPHPGNGTSVLQDRDVIVKVGPHVIDRTGNVRLGDDLQVLFEYYVAKLAHDGVVPLTIYRDGQPQEVEAPVSSRMKRVISYLDGGYPAYFVAGPMVFSSASTELVAALAADARWLTVLAAKGSPLVARSRDKPAFDGEELVVVPSQFFSHRLTKGYSNPVMAVVEQVNGTPVKNLAHLVEMLRDSKDQFLEFKFAGTHSEMLVFPRQEMLDATEEILTDNGIRRQGTDALEAVWKKQ